jgi:hypothetical protein
VPNRPAQAFNLPFFGGSKAPPLPENVVQDETLAYRFMYPLTTQSGRRLPIIVSRKPEKYSSAAPLAADARQRIVAEYVSLGEGITISVLVGPATGILKKVPPEQWTAPQVANVVLTDRSTVRTSLPLPV